MSIYTTSIRVKENGVGAIDLTPNLNNFTGSQILYNSVLKINRLTNSTMISKNPT